MINYLNLETNTSSVNAPNNSKRASKYLKDIILSDVIYNDSYYHPITTHVNKPK